MLRRREHDGIGESGLAALEVDVANPSSRSLVDDAVSCASVIVPSASGDPHTKQWSHA